MDAFLQDLCRDLRLNSVSIGMYGKCVRFKMAAYLHWDEAGEGQCASGSGDTIDDAIRMARAEMENRRSKPEAA